MAKFKGKYRIGSHRRPNWDYSSEAMYFLTIVTQNRICSLGKIINTEDGVHMKLSDFGKIVENEWFKSFEIRNELHLDVYVIMPNHIHAMVEIINPSYDVKTNVANPVVGKSNNDAETNGRLILPISPNGLPVIKRYQPIRLPKSISSFIAGFKSAVNTKIDDYIDENKMDIPKYNRNNHFFQPNYHDHIVRNQIEYDNIYNYIINNPNLWDLDSINTEKSIK